MSIRDRIGLATKLRATRNGAKTASVRIAIGRGYKDAEVSGWGVELTGNCALLSF